MTSVYAVYITQYDKLYNGLWTSKIPAIYATKEEALNYVKELKAILQERLEDLPTEDYEIDINEIILGAVSDPKAEAKYIIGNLLK